MDCDGWDNVSLVTTPRDEGLYFRGDRGLCVIREASGEELRLVTGR